MINYDLKKIKAVFFDVDGVLSKETITLNSEGEPLRTVNIKDGYSIQLAVKKGLILAVITGGKTNAIKIRYEGLGVNEVILGASVKIQKYEELKSKYNLHDEEILYMGDDIPDYEIMNVCGVPCCPADAASDIKKISMYISQYNGGEGCARDVVEQILKAQNKWMDDNIAFGW